MSTHNSYDDDLNDPVLARWLSLCRTEDERQRTITQWRERKAAEEGEREARLSAQLEPKRLHDEQVFWRIARQNYPFSDKSFEEDWPIIRARLIAEIMSKEVMEGWTAYQEQQKERKDPPG